MSRAPYIIHPDNRDVRLKRLHELLDELKSDKPWSVTVEPYVKRRSLSQNALMWKWINKVADHVQRATGEGSDDVQDFFKRNALKPKVIEIAGETVEKYSTKNLKVPEMIEYINHIYA